jgi:hypothetical protein
MALLTSIGGFGRAPARWCARGLAALALLAAVVAPAAAQPAPTKEFQVKAVFLFHFTQFVDWPASAYKDAQAPCVIGVLGDDPFGAYLDDLVRNEKIGEHPIVVRRYRAVGDIADCHVLFISSSEAGRLDPIMAGLKGRSILTVGDTEDFNRAGGIVRLFVTEQGKPGLWINVAAAKAVGLTISSKLLKAAMIVPAGNP